MFIFFFFRDTKAAYLLPAQWQSIEFVPVLKAEGCAVYLGDRKLTSHIHANVLGQWHEREAKEYLSHRHGFDTATIQSICWQSLRYSLRKLSPHRRATAVKALHRHLPTQEKLFKQGWVTMCSTCPRCVLTVETNAHVYCCSNADAAKLRKADWMEMWKQLSKCHTAPIIEHTWRHYLHPLVAIPIGNSLYAGIPITHGTSHQLLHSAISEQTRIGWDKLLVGLGSSAWITLQDYLDSNNPKPPQRSAIDWFNRAAHSLLKFSLRCWKIRNNMVHGATQKEQKTIALQKARERITNLYANPPTLAPRFRSIFEIPLAHRLKMPLQVAEQWLSMIAHQVKVALHNHGILMKQHKPMHSHLRTMRRATRQQAKDRTLPLTPKKAHSRAVQAAVKEMRLRLYAPRDPSSHSRTHPKPRRRRQRQSHRSFAQPIRPPLRPHPP